MASPWFVDEIAVDARDALPGLSVEAVDEIDSTNAELMRRARDGALRPTLLVTARQTAGRGRLGRAWQSAQRSGDGESLTFSLGVPLALADWSGLSLAVGVSVAESLDPARAAEVGLKWPNDLWVRDHKLGGILIETATLIGAHASPMPRVAVIGIGLNVGPRETEGLRTPPAWIRQWRRDITAPQLLREVAAPLLRDLRTFADEGFAPFIERFAARDVLRGREVALSDGMLGMCEGIGVDGSLRVRTSSGLQTVSSAEVSVRPTAPP